MPFVTLFRLDRGGLRIDLFKGVVWFLLFGLCDNVYALFFPCPLDIWTPDLFEVVGYKMVLSNDIDLLHPPAELEKRKHKLKRLVQSPNSFFMDVKCQGCFNITTVFSHSQTVVVCGSCQTVLCQPTGGKARLTEGCSFRKKGDWLLYSFTKDHLWWVLAKCGFYSRNKFLRVENGEFRVLQQVVKLDCW